MNDPFYGDGSAVSDAAVVRVVVHVVGFGGVQRVVSLLGQRRYPVRSFSACTVDDEDSWMVTCTVCLDRQGDLLLARLYRLPSVTEARCV